jgi:hypothetical protein
MTKIVGASRERRRRRRGLETVANGIRQEDDDAGVGVSRLPAQMEHFFILLHSGPTNDSVESPIRMRSRPNSNVCTNKVDLFGLRPMKEFLFVFCSFFILGSRDAAARFLWRFPGLGGGSEAMK